MIFLFYRFYREKTSKPDSMARFVLDQLFATLAATFRKSRSFRGFRCRVPILHSKMENLPAGKKTSASTLFFKKNAPQLKTLPGVFCLFAAPFSNQMLTWGIPFLHGQTAKRPGGPARCRLQNTLIVMDRSIDRQVFFGDFFWRVLGYIINQIFSYMKQNHKRQK